MTTEAELSQRIEQIKTNLVKLGDLRPGTLSEQYNTCRTPSCRCKADPPHKHGPYHQLSYTRNGRSRTEHVRPEDLATVQAQLRNYTKLRNLVEEWIDTAIELDRLRRTGKPSPPRQRASG